MLRVYRDRFTVPLIYNGGIGKWQDLKEVLSKTYIDAASIGPAMRLAQCQLPLTLGISVDMAVICKTG